MATSERVVANCDSLQSLRFSPHLPFVFTRDWAVMLASLLNGAKAVKGNIQIVRLFIKMRKMLLLHKDFLIKNYLNLFRSEQEKSRKNSGSDFPEGINEKDYFLDLSKIKCAKPSNKRKEAST